MIANISQLSPRGKFQFAGRYWTILSKTSAMSCASWSLPARHSCPGMVDNGPDSICHGCYAQIGCYNYENVRDCQAARYAWTIDCIRTGQRELWVDTLVSAIGTRRYFRWHDSGDIFSPQYARMILAVCKRTPRTKHWIPTRSYRLPWAADILPALQALPNVVVRPSALTFDDAAPVISGLGRGSTAIRTVEALPILHRLCPKTTLGKGASCQKANCRRCWENRQSVAYLVHGRRGHHRVHNSTQRERSARWGAVSAALAIIGQ